MTEMDDKIYSEITIKTYNTDKDGLIKGTEIRTIMISQPKYQKSSLVSICAERVKIAVSDMIN